MTKPSPQAPLALYPRLVSTSRLTLSAFLLLAAAVQAEPPRVLVPTPGGVSPLPLMYGRTNGPGGTQIVPAAGFGGGPFQAVMSTNLTGGPWVPVGPQFATNFFTLTLSNAAPACFYRIKGPNPGYAGATVCGNCHGYEGVANDWYYDTWQFTGHANAYKNLPPFGQQNPECLQCHSVGFGYPNGYAVNGNPMLRGVQCENCHGPGLAHSQNRSNPAKYPAVELTSKVCGGCHNGAHQPTYDEWAGSGHGRLDPELVAPFTNNDTNRMKTCGPCHGGSVRLALLKADPLPRGVAGGMGIECAVCHEPHGDTPYDASLRNPTFSTNNYTYFTAGSFSTQYNAAIQICGQCHNSRGASWTTTSRPPHHSPQYNMMLGTVGQLASGLPPNQPAAHGLTISNQCVGCHMQKSPYQAGPPEVPAVTGHSFGVNSYEVCADCHRDAGNAEDLVFFTQLVVSYQIEQVRTALNRWALTKAPVALRDRYGTRAWEYTIPGTLSPGGPGPTTSEQTQIPENIKKARFNLYLVQYDGSFGVHNGPFTTTLLDTALNWVRSELR